MNTNQRKYATERVAAIKSVRLSRLREEHDALRKVISPQERAALLRSGKVKLRADVTEINRYADVVDAFDFSKYEGHTEKQEAAYQAAVALIEKEAANVRDKIMLGDSDEALRLLSGFAEGTL